MAQKLYNWSTLNQRVFRRLGFVVAKTECEACASAKPSAIERVLKLVMLRLSKFAEGPAYPLDHVLVRCPHIPSPAVLDTPAELDLSWKQSEDLKSLHCGEHRQYISEDRKVAYCC